MRDKDSSDLNLGWAWIHRSRVHYASVNAIRLGISYSARRIGLVDYKINR